MITGKQNKILKADKGIGLNCVLCREGKKACLRRKGSVTLKTKATP